MTYIVDVRTTFPKNHYPQGQILDELKKFWQANFFNYERILEIQKNAGVEFRSFARPLSEYEKINNWEIRQKIWLEQALELGTTLLTDLFRDFNLDPAEVSLFMSNSVTGFAVPSIEARLMNRFAFAPSVKRVPVFGLGCLAGAALLNRAADYLVGHPKEVVVLLSVELCSLCMRVQESEMANVVSAALFGDGAGVVLMCGREHPLHNRARFRHLGGQSAFFKNTERVMGWDIAQDGLKIVLSTEVAEVVSREIPPLLNNLHKVFSPELTPDFVVGHPGGPKVLQALGEAFPHLQASIAFSWESLRQHGNLSSVSIWNVLELFKSSPEFRANRRGFFFALGPGFCAEGGVIECCPR
ncbi:MAG: hypothetical protein A2X86_02200 [Bdellovibrionales bacterium GWA2_49_15]|nr:MAG: hypothetical protein A2X86_02200 [Bdellovibrionales bacterium GWA2_49_15]